MKPDNMRKKDSGQMFYAQKDSGQMFNVSFFGTFICKFSVW